MHPVLLLRRNWSDFTKGIWEFPPRGQYYARVCPSLEQSLRTLRGHHDSVREGDLIISITDIAGEHVCMANTVSTTRNEDRASEKDELVHACVHLVQTILYQPDKPGWSLLLRGPPARFLANCHQSSGPVARPHPMSFIFSRLFRWGRPGRWLSSSGSPLLLLTLVSLSSTNTPPGWSEGSRTCT